ncbi:CLUMA_CG010611, isoform A [Clunio marinus]|uniref:CLUMA_CG010611, isoform A n=1 Tax=Clunio marinus TaxID=568069 RepID=A0A1J1IDY6_9DIPT|nr:CLUMA_CG010611, isoform A [Clunio marinus]
MTHLKNLILFSLSTSLLFKFCFRSRKAFIVNLLTVIETQKAFRYFDFNTINNNVMLCYEISECNRFMQLRDNNKVDMRLESVVVTGKP